MVARNAVGEQLPHDTQTFKSDARAPRRMINLARVSAQAGLEGLGVFTHIVQMPAYCRQRLPTKGRGEHTSLLAYALKVVWEELPVAASRIGGGVGKENTVCARHRLYGSCSLVDSKSACRFAISMGHGKTQPCNNVLFAF